ncbi:MAG: protocatechuate 3,4-dioxygenase subunit alpha [Limimaricola soesokkakensis]|uniref:protocatechuate 3,4-dioxygenase subunit alpha n=1 Tax=Limimaricola soesokkakensis TaxID=1343159 RepID=UPI0040593DF6
MQRIERLKESPSQTAGPYVHIGALPNFAGIDGVYDEDLGQRMILGAVRGEQITLCGTVFDGTGAALRDAMVEIWQADASGKYAGQDGADPAFTGWGRQAGDMETGEFAFETLKPGPVPFRDGRLMAPHISVWIVARGINLGLQTRIYFADEQEANAADPILARIEHRDRICTLMARPESDGTYRFDVRLQGEAETIFFDI